VAASQCLYVGYLSAMHRRHGMTPNAYRELVSAFMHAEYEA